MSNLTLTCPHCHKSGFASARGLTQHQTQNKVCHAKSVATLKTNNGYFTAHETLQSMPALGVFGPTAKDIYQCFQSQILAEDSIARDKLNNRPTKLARTQNNQDEEFHTACEDNQILHSDEEDNNANAINELNSGQNNNDFAINWRLRHWFDQCLVHSRQNNVQFTNSEQSAIKLLLSLRHGKASLDTYESAMEWHYQACGKLSEGVPLSAVKDCIPRKTLFKRLGIRYNITPKCAPKVTRIVLPSTKAQANIACALRCFYFDDRSANGSSNSG